VLKDYTSSRALFAFSPGGCALEMFQQLQNHHAMEV